MSVVKFSRWRPVPPGLTRTGRAHRSVSRIKVEPVCHTEPGTAAFCEIAELGPDRWVWVPCEDGGLQLIANPAHGETDDD